jgi:hypothetical protein
MDDKSKGKRLAAIGRTLDALKHTKNARYYAIDDGNLMAAAALIETWREGKIEAGKTVGRPEIVKFIEGLRDYVPSLFQNRPTDPAKIEKVLDEFTGREPENPWVTGDLQSQSVVTQQFPELAAELKKRAKHGGALSYSQVVEEREAEAKAKELRDLEYSTAQHAINPWRNPNALGAQSEARKKHGDGIASFYKREATEPVALPWVGEENLTFMGKISKQPQLQELVKRSMATAREWATETMFESEKQFAESQASRRAAEALLGRR